jgi:hypothetical protein
MSVQTFSKLTSARESKSKRATMIDAAGAQFVRNRRGKLVRTCGAKNQAGTPCLCVALGRGNRCKWHGGRSTGARTPEGKARSLPALVAGNAAWRARGAKPKVH